MKLFKIHASQCHKIMGRMGLTEAQEIKLAELVKRRDDPTAKPLTANMVTELSDLHFRYNNPELPEGARTFLKEWYAHDYEEIRSKYIDKGNIVESDNIDFAARVLGYGVASKNQVTRSDEYMVGTCDVDLPDLIIDVKSSWNRTTFQSNITGIDPQHEWQGRVYMRLYDKSRFMVFHGLLTTPATEWSDEIVFDDPENERWLAYEIKRDKSKEDEIIERVKMCRVWLEKYDAEVKAKVGKVTVL